MRITPKIQLKFSDCAILENDDDNDDGGIENQNLPLGFTHTSRYNRCSDDDAVNDV